MRRARRARSPAAVRTTRPTPMPPMPCSRRTRWTRASSSACARSASAPRAPPARWSAERPAASPAHRPAAVQTSAFGALGGALVGGIAGSAAEHVVGDTRAFEYIVRKPNGDLLSVTQKDAEPLAVGQKVLVIAGNQARVVPDYTVPVQQPPKQTAAAPQDVPTTTTPLHRRRWPPCRCRRRISRRSRRVPDRSGLPGRAFQFDHVALRDPARRSTALALSRRSVTPPGQARSRDASDAR